MKISWRALWIAILVLVFVIPYANVELLSINASQKLAAFDISCFDNVYCEGTPDVYDCKIYSYSEEKHAKVLYVFGDCEFGVMVNLEWCHVNQCWKFVEGRNLWSIYGGSAQGFYWPMYYGDKVYPLLGK